MHPGSPDEITEKILSFLDVVITKMSPSQEDIIPLESCQCEEILEVVVMPLAHHFLALGKNSKALYYFLETASEYLFMRDNYMVSGRVCPALPPPGDTLEAGAGGRGRGGGIPVRLSLPGACTPFLRKSGFSERMWD